MVQLKVEMYYFCVHTLSISIPNGSIKSVIYTMFNKWLTNISIPNGSIKRNNKLVEMHVS